jgi:16S rRNA (adenine1518-N6/adenine1519-N6)-dimethyltransferase
VTGGAAAEVTDAVAAEVTGAVAAEVTGGVATEVAGGVAAEPAGGAATEVTRAEVFAVVDAAFAQRRKSLRGALAGWAGSPAAAEQVLRAAGVDPATRAERLAIADFARIAAGRRRRPGG